MKGTILTAIFTLSCVHAAQNDSVLGAPLLGYVYDSHSRTVRTIDGIPGASLLGTTFSAGMEISEGAVSPDQSYILVVGAQSHTAHVLIVDGGEVTVRAIAGTSRRVDRIFISPSGLSAVLYGITDGVLQIVTGLPDKPTVAHEIAASAIDTVAISDDGDVLLTACAKLLRPVLVFAASAQSHELPVAGATSAMVFRPRSHDALVAAGGRIILIRNVDDLAAATYQDFDDTSSGPPIALNVSRDGRRFFAGYGDGTIQTRDVASGELFTASCPCHPTGLYPLQGDSIFRLNSSMPLFLFDAANNKVLFVARGDQ